MTPAWLTELAERAGEMRVPPRLRAPAQGGRASAVCGSCSAALADAPRFDVSLAKYATMANDTIKAADAPYAYIQNGTGRL